MEYLYLYLTISANFMFIQFLLTTISFILAGKLCPREHQASSWSTPETLLVCHKFAIYSHTSTLRQCRVSDKPDRDAVDAVDLS